MGRDAEWRRGPQRSEDTRRLAERREALDLGEPDSAVDLRPGSTTLFAPEVKPLDADELRQWRLWAESAHCHRSIPAYKIIINKAHLLIEDEMPQCLLDFCAHKAGYDVVIERWRQQDYSQHLSVVRHPGDVLNDYLQQSFTRLKHNQARELAATQGKPTKHYPRTEVRAPA
jgi:hypothetical protein